MFFLKTEQDTAILISLLAAILNFYVKRINAFISEAEQHRAIAIKFLTDRVPAESINNFS